MTNIWLLLRANLKRNKTALVLAAAGAAVLCFILYAMGNLVTDLTVSKISVGILDRDNSILSADFKNYLTNQLDYRILESQDYDKLSSELIDRHISVIIEIPEDFYEQFAAGSSSELTITSLEDFENAAFVQAYMNNYLNSIRILSSGAAGKKEVFDHFLKDYNKNETAVAKEAAASEDTAQMKEQDGFINSIGFYLMMIFVICVVLSYMLLDDRHSGVFSRIQITPVKPLQYILGSGIFGFFLCLLQIAIYCGYIYLADINTGIPLPVLIALMTLFSVFAVCFALAISLAAGSKNTVTSIIIGFSTIGCILGGAYFPLNLAPKNLQNLARILPQFWFMDALRKLQENVTANLAPNFIILGLFAALTLLLGAVLFSQNYMNN